MSLDEVPVKVEVKWEPDDAEDTATDLYLEHEVKQELVLGPELLQIPDASMLQENVKCERNICISELGHGALKFCCVKLERLPLSMEGNFQMPFFVCEFCDSFFKFRYTLKTHQHSHVRHLLLDNDKSDISSFGYIKHEQSSKKEVQKSHTSNSCITQALQETDLSSNEFDTEPFAHRISDDNLLELSNRQHEDTSESAYRDLINKEGTHFCASCGTDIQAKLWDFETHLLNHIKKNPKLKQVFKEKIRLAIHKRHVCDVCQKQFKRPYLLQRHRKLHTEKALTCNICKRKFTRKYCLLRHIEKPCIARQRMYPCQYCDKSYSRIFDYNRHLRISHVGAISCHSKKKIHNHMFSGREDYMVTHTDNSDSTLSEPLFRVSADNVCDPRDFNSRVQSVNFQESTLFNRLQLLNQTLNLNRVEKSKPNCP